jgi:hypothetical protein
MAMRGNRKLYLSAAATAIIACLSTVPTQLSAQQPTQQTDPAIRIGDNDLGGIVTGPNGPEAGVWVIAETTELSTKMAKMVVTDDRGRYVLPDLPKANYSVWVRGYGLVDSPKVTTAPGKILNLTAVAAPTPAAAAHYYPPIYWFSMLQIPDKSLFPGTGEKGNGMPANQKSQQFWIDSIKSNGCVGCHQLGNEATRTIPAALGQFETSAEAWTRRIQSGQASESMVTQLGRLDVPRAIGLFGEWTDRIAKGELPASQPQRPQGVERNVVVTVWDWSEPKAYLHDEISTDKRHPTLNGYGKLYGAPELSTDMLPVLDPAKNTTTEMKIPVRDPKTPSTKADPMFAPSPYWGDEHIWDSQASVHNPMLDEKGRVWYTARIRPAANPDFCKQGSDHPSAKLTPIDRSGRQLAMFDPKTDKFTLINTCFGTHHLVFAEDANNTLWTSSGGAGNVVGWLDRKMFDETGDEQKSQGWTALILDINGNGKRDDYVGPKDPIDPTKDKQIQASFYGIAVSPVDGSIWGSIRQFPGEVVRLNPGSHPPETALAEIYEVPWDDKTVAMQGYGPRGMDIDRNGVVWTPLSSGHLASFDRRKCKGPLNGPTATGKHCPEGWTLYPFPGPQLQGVKESGSAEAAYYAWVDQFNTLGLGNNVPIATGNENDALLALVDGKFVTLRVPYPMGFYAKGLDGRIDDPNGGWKGRGVWSTSGNRTPFHIEGGKGTLPKVVHFQVRPDPLAR